MHVEGVGVGEQGGECAVAGKEPVQGWMEIVAVARGVSKKEAKNAAAREAVAQIEKKSGIALDALSALSARLPRPLAPHKADLTQTLSQIESGIW